MRKRQEYILNVLLLGIITLVFTLFTVVFINYIIFSGNHDGIQPFSLLFIIIPFILLLLLSRKGYVVHASYFFILLIWVFSTYPLIIWGILLPQSILMYGLIVVLVGVLLGNKSSFLITSILLVGLLTIVFFGNKGIIIFDRSWKLETGGYNDAISYGATLGCIGLVSWLFNREINNSIYELKKSKLSLQRERNSLDKKVKARTKTIEDAKIDKMLGLHHLAEFGRVSSSLLHDLMSPLTSVILNLEMLENSHNSKYLSQARDGIDYIEKYALNAKRQLIKESVVEIFDVSEEIKKVVHLLDQKASEKQIPINVITNTKILIKGDSVLFSQIIANLIMNAIDAYSSTSINKAFGVRILSKTKGRYALIQVHDKGKGIAKKDLQHIFDAFYTTKSYTHGTGIGLTITKRSIEESFKGKISVKSSVETGTIFTIKLALVNKK